MKKLLMLLVATFVIVMSLKAQNFDTEKVLRHLNRAEVCIEMNKIDDAIKEYQEIVKIAPNWSNVYMYLGNSYSLKDDDISLSKSIEYYNKFLQMTDDQELYIEAKDRISRVEMVRELKAKETKRECFSYSRPLVRPRVHGSEIRRKVVRQERKGTEGNRL